MLVASTIAFIPSIAAADPAPGAFEGDLSHAGVALVTWGGGTTAEMEAAAPTASSFWMGTGGHMIGWIVGAPPFVNSAWNEITEGRPLPSNFQMLVIIDHDSTQPPQ